MARTIVMIRKLLVSDMRFKLLLLEAYGQLGWARMEKAMPFGKIAPSLGKPMAETSCAPAGSIRMAEAESVARALRIAGRFTPWESKCLVTAIAGTRMLRRRGIASTLYLGTAKDERTGGMKAHAWLRSGDRILTGAEQMDRYTTVAMFASGDGRLEEREL
ncbi:lasso peptide biosynthesis B2 protein [Paenibacillus sp. NPDC058071]|uniref:lasso peptide biosynthesis B2 protein n=1 Tax=Paenibacillus sp. NPDC058071 TaxID=3346326 RepID=UPI0036D8DF1D